MAGTISVEVVCGEPKKTDGGACAGAILGMGGALVLLLQMDEGAGELDEALEEGVVAAFGLEPEVLEDVVRLVVALGIEAGEIALVVRVEAGGLPTGGEAADHFLDFIGLFHVPGGQIWARKAKLQMGTAVVILGDSMRLWVFAVILILLAAASALFSAIETALFSLQPLQLRHLRTRNPGLADRLSRLLENPRRVLSALLLADALANVPLIVLSLYTLNAVGLPVPFWMAAVVLFGVIAIVCDLGPKLIALGEPYRLATLGVHVMGVLLPLLDPVSRVLQRWSERIADAATPTRLKTLMPMTAEELETLVQLSAEDGILEAAESEMIQEILKLGEKTAKDCMTPRVDLFAIPDNLTNEEAVQQLRAGRHRRVPVYGETPDDVEGTLDVIRFLLNPKEHYTEQLNPPSFVPETMKALDLMKSFIKHPQGMAVVVDEFGGFEGVATLNDIIEEIISDAVPSGEQELYIEPLDKERVIAGGRTRLDDLAELGFHLEEDGVDTIGGLIFNHIGSVPRVGMCFQINKVWIKVRRSSRRGVEEVMLAKDREEAEA